MKYSDPSQKTQREFYEACDPEYLKFQKNIPYANYLVKQVLTVLPGKLNSVLEVGAGQGRFTFALARHVKKLVATDFSEKEIGHLKEQVKQLKVNNVEARVADIFTISSQLRGQKFDHLAGFFILHHLPRDQYSQVVRQLFSLLKRGGRLVFIEPNNLYPFHLVEMLITPLMSWEIERGIYTNYLGRFKQACREGGLRLIHEEKFGFMPPPLINLWPEAVRLNRLIESIPLISQCLCPFVLLSFVKK